jgi:hypothetical protein
MRPYRGRLAKCHHYAENRHLWNCCNSKCFHRFLLFTYNPVNLTPWLIVGRSFTQIKLLIDSDFLLLRSRLACSDFQAGIINLRPTATSRSALKTVAIRPSIQ